MLYDRGVSAENGQEHKTTLLFAWSPTGYHLHELAGEPPQVGSELEHDGQRLLIVKIGASPLPGDPRRCAYSVGA